MTSWDTKFKTPRISLLQPGIDATDLDQKVQQSSERLVLDSYRNIVMLWAEAHPEIPKGKLDNKFDVKAAARQPVSSLSADLQIIRRRIEPRVEPASKAEADTTPLPRGTPLTIVPLEEVSFPTTTSSSTHRLPGGEQVNPCTACDASGHIACDTCGQTGRVACSTCGGGKRLRCPTCGGNGLLLINLVRVACASCLQNGFQICTACIADGTIRCSGCSGDGYNTCTPCGGYGRVCHYHVLISEVLTQSQSIFHSAEAWPVDTVGIATDMESLWVEELPLSFAKTGRGTGSFATEEYAPPLSTGMTEKVRSILNDAVEIGRAEQATAETVRAVRFRAAACYVHRLTYTLNGGDASSILFIGGLSNRVAPGDLESRCRSSTAWAQRPWHSLLRAIGLVENMGPSQKFRQRIATDTGQIHLLDTDVYVAEAVEASGLTVTVSETGYALTRADGTSAGDIEMTHDSKQERLLVSFLLTVGPAYREKFIAALGLNSKLTFGRIGLHQDSSSGVLEFRLCDVRLYSDIDAAQYSTILNYLLGQALTAAKKAL